MRLTKLYVRFYKSFNYDYERKAKRDSRHDPWEVLDDGSWYPFVRIDLEPDITTIVGANEAGKSHLLNAIEKVLTGEDIKRSDFCRYSAFFSVEQGRLRTPDFGGELLATTARDVERLRDGLGIEVPIGGRFRVFRLNGSSPVIYSDGKNDPIELKGKQIAALVDLLPKVFSIDAEVPLPDSISLHRLTEKARKGLRTRQTRWSIMDTVSGWASAEQATKGAPGLWTAITSGDAPAADDKIEQQENLAKALLFEVAEIDEGAIEDLDTAIYEGREGYVNGVIEKINVALARHLNFPRWWAQDRDFRLMVSPREYELVFTIRDRTGTDYSFRERSHGLRYFLSYYVQLRAHERSLERDEILLMDEPDAYLSSQGQQDLLRILRDYALPEDRVREDQVVYVTHSPFLIDRNAGSRIRVLDKGVGTEGTRVVGDAAQNNYEPLRSSLGPFVAETAFIGGANLFVEGLSDQVLLAGISSHLRVREVPPSEIIDLNDVTIVPSGGASSLPYMVFLARGRDEIHPPSVALVDGDTAGLKAAADLKRGGPRHKQVLAEAYVVELGSWAASNSSRLQIATGIKPREPEDLIPLSVATEAARAYGVRVLGLSRSEAENLREADIEGLIAGKDGAMWKAVDEAFATRLGPDAHIEKVGFAKEVVSYIAASVGAEPLPLGIAELESNFRILLAEIARRLRKAVGDEESSRLNDRLVRVLDRFLDDHTSVTIRENGKLALEAVEDALDDSPIGDRIRAEVHAIRREFDLDEDPLEPIAGFADFCERFGNLRYTERLSHQEDAFATAGRARVPVGPGKPVTPPIESDGATAPAEVHEVEAESSATAASEASTIVSPDAE